MRSTTPLDVRVEGQGAAGRACWAPAIQLHLLPDGIVRACCRNVDRPLGNIATDRLADIWAGSARAELIERLRADDFSMGCRGCEREIAVEGRAGSYPTVFDELVPADALADDASPAWPVRMEFNLSNRCNLQCIQCHGDLSSSIRIHREGRPALPQVYGDEFFEDLRAFLPHLRTANFAGGEPFLAPENFRVWELMTELCPDVDVSICTNATQWNSRVERVLDTLRPSIIMSIDGFRKEAYEAIRIGSDHAQVFENVARFGEYAARTGTRLDINFCLMPQNVREFPDLVLFAEERDITVNVSVVRVPNHASIPYLQRHEIAEIAAFLHEASDRILPHLDRNRHTWLTELARIDAWVGSEDSVRNPDRRIMAFASKGEGAVDDGEARRGLVSRAPGRRVHAVVVDVDERVASCSSSLLHLLGVERDRFVGGPMAAFQPLVIARFGDANAYEVHHEDADRLDCRARFGEVDAEVAMVALRDRTGWADHIELLVAFDVAEEAVDAGRELDGLDEVAVLLPPAPVIDVSDRGGRA